MRGRPAQHQLLADAATEPALHCRHPKKLVGFAGSTKAIGQSVRDTATSQRHSALNHRLAERSRPPAIRPRAVQTPLRLTTKPPSRGGGRPWRTSPRVRLGYL